LDDDLRDLDSQTDNADDPGSSAEWVCHDGLNRTGKSFKSVQIAKESALEPREAIAA
jgi:hypothetical protein